MIQPLLVSQLCPKNVKQPIDPLGKPLGKAGSFISVKEYQIYMGFERSHASHTMVLEGFGLGLEGSKALSPESELWCEAVRAVTANADVVVFLHQAVFSCFAVLNCVVPLCFSSG